jgi:hypothetical protein
MVITLVSEDRIDLFILDRDQRESGGKTQAQHKRDACAQEA